MTTLLHTLKSIFKICEKKQNKTKQKQNKQKNKQTKKPLSTISLIYEEFRIVFFLEHCEYLFMFNKQALGCFEIEIYIFDENKHILLCHTNYKSHKIFLLLQFYRMPWKVDTIK